MRPKNLAEFAGQQQFLGEGKLLRRLLKADRLGSVLFYGPPGTGKTTLARLLAAESRSKFVQLNAVTSGVKDLREVLSAARDRLSVSAQKTLLFVDEIHRFNKSQQDVLLPDVEEGVVILVGATTQNPFFAINSALVSRSRIFQFQPLSADDIKALLRRALADRERGLGQFDVRLQDDALEFLAEVSDGDARRALSALEIGVLSSDEQPLVFTRALAEESVQRKALEYDATGDAHYDAASARSKASAAAIPTLRCTGWRDAGSGRGRPLSGAADCDRRQRRHRQRRSAALSLAVAAMQATEFVGLPECQYALAQATTYLACAPKSNATTVAIGEARRDVTEGRLLPVPVHLKDRHYAGAKRLGHGENYEYAHNAEGGVAAQDYLGVEREYYRPVPRGFEAELAERLKAIRARLREGRQSSDAASEA